MNKELLALNWKDFSSYPKKGQKLMIHAYGYDTHERTQKHIFFKLKSFDIDNFPTKRMLQSLNKHHCRWYYQWLPAKKNK